MMQRRVRLLWSLCALLGLVGAYYILAFVALIGFQAAIAPGMHNPPPVGSVYNPRAAILSTLQASEAGDKPSRALRFVSRLPRDGCWVSHEEADGRIRCVDRFGSYFATDNTRARAYATIGELFLNWPDVEDRFGVTKRPSTALARALATHLNENAEYVFQARDLPAPLAKLGATPVAAAIYWEIGDSQHFEKLMARTCNYEGCDIRAALYVGDLDRTVRAAEMRDFSGGNMGQQGLIVDERVALIDFLIKRQRPDLALRLGRILMRDYEGYPREATQALRSLQSVAPSNEFRSWIEQKDVAANGPRSVKSASAAAIAVAGWKMLRENERAEKIRELWTNVGKSEDRYNCTMAGPSTRNGEPPGAGEHPACLMPYRDLIEANAAP